MILLYAKAIRKLGAKTVLERLRRLAINLAGTFGCEVCGAVWPEMFPFMVTDGLWEEVVGDEDAHLCLDCLVVKMREKIGRDLDPEDIVDVPVNRLLLTGVRIGKKAR